MKMHLKISSAKSRPFCPGADGLTPGLGLGDVYDSAILCSCGAVKILYGMPVELMGGG